MEWILAWVLSAPICFYLMVMASKAERETIRVKDIVLYTIMSLIPVAQQALIMLALVVIFNKLDSLDTVVFDFSKRDRDR